ncbi:helix-turn-helix domain-containing protein [Mycolicibacterium farcinogenes]|uniref:Helix-turn-helix transcriptional regulator n=1 Tax=Mycolicibacterium farcinogenes TaxID=1802 RepID=A0ACD1FI71_MYCFR|nr:helix-turn-helix transcriptional regulator [Mycolicibacterium farcinogenes]QZH66726.1 helix-turn-helix transcriptional regulator [Mycolicibacterium farcinogenes]
MGDDEQQWTPKRVTTADAAAGAVLRRVRERAGLTLDQAAEASGISKPVLSRTERGERPARVTELLPLATAYGVTAAELAAAIAADPAVQAAAMQ